MNKYTLDLEKLKAVHRTSNALAISEPRVLPPPAMPEAVDGKLIMSRLSPRTPMTFDYPGISGDLQGLEQVRIHFNANGWGNSQTILAEDAKTPLQFKGSIPKSLIAYNIGETFVLPGIIELTFKDTIIEVEIPRLELAVEA